VAAQQKWRCLHCQELLDARFDLDHIKPLHAGGSDSLKNLQALCANCHYRKTHLEILRMHDKIRENKTGKSRYWDPLSVDFLQPQK
jgi:5-methylcytosine-specific restriction endonuclease McrA